MQEEDPLIGSAGIFPAGLDDKMSLRTVSPRSHCIFQQPLSIWMAAALVLGLLPTLLLAEPQIKQVFPTGNTLLGQSLIWLIEITHPMHEAYSLRINPCKGAEIQIMERKVAREGNRILTRYRLKITATDLTVTEIPSVILSDEKGQSTVLNGKPLVVRSISGGSLDIRPPGIPHFQSPATGKSKFVVAAVLFSFTACAYFYWKRRQRNHPRQLFLRALTRALAGIQQESTPLYLTKLLRSRYLWGVAAEACTASQLREMARADRRLVSIAEAVEVLDTARYSRNRESLRESVIEKAVRTALEIVHGRNR